MGCIVTIYLMFVNKIVTKISTVPLHPENHPVAYTVVHRNSLATTFSDTPKVLQLTSTSQ